MHDYTGLAKVLRYCATNGYCLDCPVKSDCTGTFGDRLLQAADAIEALQRMVNAHSWISVEERLPEDEKSVLVWSDTNPYAPSFMTFGRWREWLVWESSWDGDEIPCVTYWMPLPKPPKEVE